MVKFLDLAWQHKQSQSEIRQAIDDIIENSRFIGGTPVENFEKDFGSFQSIKHVVGVGNGTDALEIAIESLDLPVGSEVLVPANSFISSAEAVTRNGLKVVFCDVDSSTYTITPETLKNKVNKKTSAIMAVHLYGHPCDMQAIRDFAVPLELKVIEDCAQAHGASSRGIKVGNLGDVGCFSFYPGKNLGALGDAGAIVTNDPKLAERCRLIANHGRLAKYDHLIEGRNSRLDALQAAVLSAKLAFLAEWNLQRIKLAEVYHENLKEVAGLALPECKPWAVHVYHLFVIRTTVRDQLKSALLNQGIETGIHYPTALPKLAAFEYLDQKNENMFCNKVDWQLLSLPIGPHLNVSDIERVCETIKDILAEL